MNDEFLYELRVPPRRAFADALYSKISQPRQSIISFSSFSPSFKQFAWWGAVVALVVGAIAMAYPEVGAQTGALVRKIGQMIFTDTWIFPKNTSTPILVWTPQQETKTLAEAKRTLPFALKTPAWTPEGYVFYDSVTVVTMFPPTECSRCQTGWSVTMMWRKPISTPSDYGRNRITLKIVHPGGVSRAADLQTLEELTINGRPTALLGPWGAAPANPRDPNLSKELMWIEDDGLYELSGMPGVRVEDLIHMAETIR